jgi:GNAT superfamily N-acetyltransferase
MPCWVAREGDDVVGFLALTAHRDWSRELHEMGVLPDHHGKGAGRALVAAAEEAARTEGIRWLLVKTLGPSHPDPGYAATRAFYLACGFEPLEELADLWPGNPALLMVKPLF